MPVLARVYHVPPGDSQKKLTLGELLHIQADYKRLLADAEDAGGY
jgi:hypothetical protein